MRKEQAGENESSGEPTNDELHFHGWANGNRSIIQGRRPAPCPAKRGATGCTAGQHARHHFGGQHHLLLLPGREG